MRVRWRGRVAQIRRCRRTQYLTSCDARGTVPRTTRPGYGNRGRRPCRSPTARQAVRARPEMCAWAATLSVQNLDKDLIIEATKRAYLVARVLLAAPPPKLCTQWPSLGASGVGVTPDSTGHMACTAALTPSRPSGRGARPPRSLGGFEKAGLEFIEENGGGPGMRLRNRISRESE
jgi:hypothetical protein